MAGPPPVRPQRSHRRQVNSISSISSLASGQSGHMTPQQRLGSDRPMGGKTEMMLQQLGRSSRGNGTYDGRNSMYGGRGDDDHDEDTDSGSRTRHLTDTPASDSTEFASPYLEAAPQSNAALRAAFAPPRKKPTVANFEHEERIRAAAADAAPSANPTLDPHVYPDTAAFREINDVLVLCATHFPELLAGTELEMERDAFGNTPQTFNAVSLALSLVEDSTRMENFSALQRRFDRAISSTLLGDEASYRAYENSLSTHHMALTRLQATQESIKSMRKLVLTARARLEAKAHDSLVAMSARLRHLEEMGTLLDDIEHVRSAPDAIEALVSEKRFVRAVVQLNRALRRVAKSELTDVGALMDLRRWLKQEEGVLLERIIEELHSHLYLKSPYCDARWRAYTPGQSELPLVDFGYDTEIASRPQSEIDLTTTAALSERPATKLDRFLHHVSLHGRSLDEEDEADEDDDDRTLSQTIEGDSFIYLESLLESVALLDRLPYAVESVTQSMSAEIFHLIENTIEDVLERGDFGYVDAKGAVLSLSDPAPVQKDTSSSETLRDLFWTLFSKLDAVLQGLRVLYEVGMRIAERSERLGASGTLLSAFIAAWKALRHDVRVFISAYLSESEDHVQDEGVTSTVLRLGRTSKNASRLSYSFSNSADHTKELAKYESDLENALRAAIPGAMLENVAAANRANYSATGGATHVLVVPSPSAGYASDISVPVSAFVARVKEILPAGVLGEEERLEGLAFFLDESGQFGELTTTVTAMKPVLGSAALGRLRPNTPLRLGQLTRKLSSH